MEKGEAIKAKGDELVSKFYPLMDGGITKSLYARKCAIVHVKGIIVVLEELKKLTADSSYDLFISEWNEVLNYLKSKL